MRKRRSAGLRDRFGPEYDRTLQERDGRRPAETELRNRQKERERFTITPLPEPARLRYAEQWRGPQERFVAPPAGAVIAADPRLPPGTGAGGCPARHLFAPRAPVVAFPPP